MPVIRDHKPIEIKNDSVELTGIRLTLTFPRIRNGGHDAKVIAVLQIINYVKIIANAISANLAVIFHPHRDSRVLPLGELTFSVKLSYRE